jgi:pimeloyl-ACP methyl ester carboxylesterase
MNTVTSKDGTKIAFDKTGSGPAVIIVNGAMQYRAMDPGMARLAELLSKDFTVYNYDRRGRGESTDTAPFAKEREIEDVAALIEDAGRSAMVYGISSGGALVLDAAQSVPGITKIFLYEVPFIVNDSRLPVPADYVDHLNQLVKDGKRDEAVKYFLVEAVGIPAEYLGGMDQDPLWPRMLGIAHTIAYDGSFVADAMQGKPLPADRWAKVTMPALLMDGGNSNKGWMGGAADAIAALLPHAERGTLEGQDHNVDPAVIAPVIAEFFKG